MGDRRWRGGPTDRDGGSDDQVDRGPWPGKRSVTGSGQDDAVARWPGKRSTTHAMRMPQETTLTGKPRRTMREVAQQTIDRKGSGQPVDRNVRARVEPQLGVTLDDVRVHTDDHAAEGAAAIEARAFTFGKDVFLGPGEQPTDLALMAHELTHVAQQSDEPRRQVAIGAQDHPAEREADAVSTAVTSGQAATGARIVDDGATPAAGQMTRSELMTKLHEVAVRTASSSIGLLWREENCSYIDDWFSRHAATPTPQLEALLQRFTHVSSPQSATDYLAPVGTRLATTIARWRGGGDITSDLAEAGVSSNVPAGAQSAGAPTATAMAKHTANAAGGAFEAGSPAAIAHELGDGQPLDGTIAAKAGDAYGASFSNVRVHTDAVAARMTNEHGATAFAVGEHVAFAPNAYQPNTPHGDALIAHELAHVVQQDNLGPAAVQKKKIDDDSVEPAEVEADQAATGFMARVWGGAKTAVKKITEVATKSQMARCSGTGGVPIPTDPFVARLHAKLYSTPRDLAGVYSDLAGLNRSRAGDGVVRTGLQTFVTNSKLSNAEAWRSVAYQEYGPDPSWPLPVKNFAEGVDAGKFPSTFPPGGADALRQYCVLTASGSADGSANVMQTYRNQFNARFDDPALAAMSPDLDPSLDSKGPRTPRARHIFTALYADPAVKTAYDTNTPAGFRNMADTFVGPDGSNLTASPRLQDLRAALNGGPVAAPNTAAPAYTALVGTIRPLAQALDARDRQEIQRSHTWRLASDAKVTGPVDVQDDLWSVITTSRSAAPVVAPPPAGPVAAPAAPPVPNAAQTAFLGSIHLTAPVTPSNATIAEHPLTFQVRGSANPALPVKRRIVVEPAAQVLDGAPDEVDWASGATAADALVHVDPAPTAGPSTVFTAKLTMPPLALATFPEQTATVTVFDKRLDWVRTNAQPGLLYSDDNQPTWVASGSTIHYTGKQCPITVSPFFTGNAPNPGLDLQMDGVLKMGGAVKQAMARIPFGAHSAQATLLNTILQEPSPAPAIPENWELTVNFYVGAAPAIAHHVILPFKLAKSGAGNIAGDRAMMTADNAWLNGPIGTAGTLLHDMRARGGHHAAVATAVSTGALKVRACFVRSDSADAVTGLGGNPVANVAYAMGVVDALGTGTNTLVAQPGATGWRWGAHADTVFLNATITHGGARRTLAELGDFLAHEGTHAADRDGGAPGDWDSYSTEFRAYWIEGTGAGLSTAFDPTMTGLGPKAPRARAIFEFLYGSATYPFVKPAYDGNVSGFRERADNYLFPDGINLTLSGTLGALRTEIETGTPVAPAAYAAKETAVVAKYGACTASDKQEIRNNREWRDLVEAQFVGNTADVPPKVQKDEIKKKLGIPL